jgi:flagellar biosynthesis protein FlhG
MMASQTDALRQFIAASGPRSQRDAKNVVVVATGKGGAGSSTIAALIASASARSGRATLLIDASVSASSLSDVLGVTNTAGDGTTVHQLAPQLHFIARPDVLDPSTIERRSRLRRLASHHTSHRLVLIDAGASAEAVSSAIQAGAGRLLAVATTDRLGVAATFALVKYVAQQHPAVNAAILVNRADLSSGNAAYGRIADGSDQFLERTAAFAGSMPDDEMLRASIEAGFSPNESFGRAAHAAELLADLLIASGSSRNGRPNLLRVT